MHRAILGIACLLLAVACPSLASGKGPASARYADNTSGIFWFMHISDTHVTDNDTNSGLGTFDKNGGIVANATFALGEASRVISPKFIVHTGDLVDNGSTAHQWDLYTSITSAAGVTLANYIDLPGNHDGIANQYFPNYLANSVLGTSLHQFSNEWTVTTSLDGAPAEYYFFGMNSAGYSAMDGTNPVPGFSTGQIDALDRHLKAHSSAELVFVMAHHPLTDSDPLPANREQVIALVEGAGAFYLHGHRHLYGGSLSDGKIVTFEISDLAQAARQNLGVGAVDHNAFVYRATSVARPWPLVIITAPVSSTLGAAPGGSAAAPANPYAYTVCNNRVDNPVRALVFSKDAPAQVQVTIANLPAVAMTPFGSPASLWGAHVDTSALAAGLHEIVVTATLADGRSNEHRISAQLVACPAVVDAGSGGGDAAADAALAGDAAADAAFASDAAHQAEPAAKDSGCACAVRGRAAAPGWPLGIGLAAMAMGWALGWARRSRRRRSRRRWNPRRDRS